MRLTLHKIVAGALAAAVLTATAATASFAQTPTPTEKPGAERANAFLDALASRLGKTRDDLRAAIVAAEKDLIAKALADGKLTKEQADRLTQRAEQSGGLGGFSGPKIPPKAHGPAAPKVAATGELAQFLGFQTPAELLRELRSGKSLADIAQAKGKSRDDLKTFLTNQAKTRLDKLVADGKLTRERADRQLKNLTDRLDQVIDHRVTPRNNGRTRIDRGAGFRAAPTSFQ